MIFESSGCIAQISSRILLCLLWKFYVTVQNSRPPLKKFKYINTGADCRVFQVPNNKRNPFQSEENGITLQFSVLHKEFYTVTELAT